MARLTPAEVSDLKTRLFEWRSPEDLSRLVDEVMDRLESVDLFNQPGLAFVRDAWIAGAFGKRRDADRVRLIDNNWPDFELMIGGQIEAFEAVEADDPQRRRGDEYETNTGSPMPDRVEDWIARAEQAPARLSAACEKKVGKRYAMRENLVIYLNLSEYGIRQQEVEGCFVSATAIAKDAFAAVWVLWKKQAYLVWKDGRPPPVDAASHFPGSTE
jgi:hypothetical protein